MHNVDHIVLGRLLREEVAIRGTNYNAVAKQLNTIRSTVVKIASGRYPHPNSPLAKKVLNWIRIKPEPKVDAKVNNPYVAYEKLTSYEVYSLFLEILECASKLDLPKELLDKISLLLEKLR